MAPKSNKQVNSCAGPIPGDQQIGLLQRTSWRIAQEPDWAAGQCPQSIRSSRPPPAATRSHHHRDEGKASLAGRICQDKVQALCFRVSLRERFRSTISLEAVRSSFHDVWTF